MGLPLGFNIGVLPDHDLQLCTSFEPTSERTRNWQTEEGSVLICTPRCGGKYFIWRIQSICVVPLQSLKIHPPDRLEVLLLRLELLPQEVRLQEVAQMALHERWPWMMTLSKAQIQERQLETQTPLMMMWKAVTVMYFQTRPSAP